MKNVIRWVLLLPSMVAAWVGTFYLAILSIPIFETFVHAGAETSDSASQSEISAIEIAMVFGSSLSALLVVSIAALVAPRNKVMFAWIALALGAVVATAMNIGLGGDLWAPYIAAITSGVAAAGVIQWRYKNH